MKNGVHPFMNEHGSILFITVGGLAVLLLFMAAAIDITYCFIVRNQLQNIADMAALAAMGAFTKRMTNVPEGEDPSVTKIAAVNAAIDAAQRVGNNAHTIDRRLESVTISANDIDFGTYDFDLDPPAFVEAEGDPQREETVVQAIRVTVRKSDELNVRYRFYLRMLTDFKDLSMETHATATLVRKNVFFLLDISSTMDDRTYLKNTSTLKRERPNIPIEDSGNTSDDGFEYFDFKTYPAGEYVRNGQTYGGLPQPMYDLLSVLDIFFSNVLYNIFDDTFDRAGFITFNWDVDDRADRLTGNSLVNRDDLLTLSQDCRHSQAFLVRYLADSRAMKTNYFSADPTVPEYNPAVLNSSRTRYAAEDPNRNTGVLRGRVTSVTDYKCAPFGYGIMNDFPAASAAYELEHNPMRYIFPGGAFPAGEDTNRNHYLDREMTGYTNMGAALAAVGGIINAFYENTSGIPAFNMVILLSDGLPTVYYSGSQPRPATSSWELSRARSFTRQEADRLKDAGVRICTIFFESTTPADGADFLADEIATSPEYHFTESDPSMVESILNQLVQTFPYVLVE